MPQPGKIRVMVVDDEKVIADTLALILRAAGYATSASYSATEALDAFPEFCPDLVLSDVMLGDGNGLELGIRFHQARPECRILLFSGAVTEAELRRMSPEGSAFEFLSKPVHPKALIACIRSLFDATHLASA